PSQPERVAEQIAAGTAVQTQHHVFEDGERRKQSRALKGTPNAGPGHSMGPEPKKGYALEENLPRLGRVQSAQAVEERRLPRSVGTDEAGNRPALKLEVDLVERDDAAESHGNVADTQQGVVGRQSTLPIARPQRPPDDFARRGEGKRGSKLDDPRILVRCQPRSDELLQLGFERVARLRARLEDDAGFDQLRS